MGKHEKKPERDILDRIAKIATILASVAQIFKILRDILKG